MDRALPPLNDRTVQSVLAGAAHDRPSAPALRDSERALDFATAYHTARVFGGGWTATGVGRGKSALLMLDNHLDFVLSWLGLALTGAVEVPINTAYRGDMLVHVINDSGAQHLLVDDRYCARLAAIAARLTTLETVIVRGGSGTDLPPGRFNVVPFTDFANEQPVEPYSAQPWDVMAIMYTSGTTGPSKGVLVTHAQAYGYCTPALWGASDESDTVLVTLPLFHVGGQWAGVYNSLIGGAEAIVLDRFHATTFWDDVRRYDATYTLLLGAMAGFLYRQPARQDDADNPLRRALMVPVIPEFADFSERFGVAIGTAYGSTEASTPIFTRCGEVASAACGQPRSDFDVRIVDEHDIELADGEVGELVVRPHEPWSVMAGYHGRSDTTVAVWRNQWLHTGDAFRRDDEGNFHFVDRLTDAIRRRGENISSYEVENAIHSHTAVLESAVIGIGSEFTEEEVLAVVVLRPGFSLGGSELCVYLADRLPYFMVPRFIEFVDALPKTPTQKVRKHELRTRGASRAAWDREAAGFKLPR